jgi:capsular polysaccharide biosynthesis protein
MQNPPSFNLDQAIAAWRDELARQPGLTPADLRELEAHLRDGFAEFKAKGLADDEAFQLARKRVGPSGAVAAEFAKASPGQVGASRLFWVVFGLFLFASYDDIITCFHYWLFKFSASVGLVGPELYRHPQFPVFSPYHELFGYGVAIYWLVRGVPQFLAHAASSRNRVATFGIATILVTSLSGVPLWQTNHAIRIFLLLFAWMLAPSPGRPSSQRRWRWLVFGATFLVVFGVFVGYVVSATPEYVATATVKIVRSDASVSSDPQGVAAYLREMEASALALRVADLLSPDDRQAFLAPFTSSNPSNPDANLVDRLLSRRTAAPGRVAYILQVSVEHPDPRLAAVVTDDFARAFVETQNANPQLAAKGVKFQSLNDASGNVFQSEPKAVLLLTAGLFFGLLAAFVVAALLPLVWESLRFRSAPPQLAT